MSKAIECMQKYAVEQCVYCSASGEELKYCRKIMFPELPGEFPAVIFFHGAGERGSDNCNQLTHGASELLAWCEKHQQKALLLFPQCPAGMQWVDTPWGNLSHSLPPVSRSMSLALQMLEYETAAHDTDLNRIYVAGISMGGYGTWDALSRFPEKFAAAFPVCGGADTAQAPHLTGIPVLTYHGDSDPTVPVSRTRDMVKAVRDAGGRKITYVELPGCGHDSWSQAFAAEKNWEWLFSCRKVSAE